MQGGKATDQDNYTAGAATQTKYKSTTPNYETMGYVELKSEYLRVKEIIINLNREKTSFSTDKGLENIMFFINKKHLIYKQLLKVLRAS